MFMTNKKEVSDMPWAKSNENIERLAQRMCAFEPQAYKGFSDLFVLEIKLYFIRCGLIFSDAEDLTVSCITDIALQMDRYRQIEGVGFAAWVLTLVRYALVDWLRSRKESLSYVEDIARGNLIDSLMSDNLIDDMPEAYL